MTRIGMCTGWSVFALLAACPRPDAESLERKLERAAEAGFSGAVSITSNGERLIERGYGLANRERRSANTAGTAFDVGSILKVFTALGIYTLQEAGELNVTDRLGELLPDVPPDKASITLRDVLLHRAGFAEYHDTEGDFEPMTREEARARILAEPLLFAPGSDEAYSNSGYTLLADIIEAVSGTSYTDYIRQAVFAKAAMTESGFYSESVWRSVPTAVGYGAETFQDNDPASWPYTWSLMGNGGLVTTVRDLDRFAVALWDERILGAAQLDAFRREYLSSGAARVDGETVYAAAGAGDYGLGGVLIDVPGRRLRIAIASNTYDAFDIESFAQDLLVWLLTREPRNR
ncbi:MAG TPA: serine hydrolase domain-containing protein [Polyangiales bacterium]|nr:serine hydrolase domain-containing protein [Polyangiales bacterium]